MRTIKSWMATNDSIILLFNGADAPESIDISDSRYKEIYPLLSSPTNWPKAVQILDKYLIKLNAAKGAARVDGKVQIDGDDLPDELSKQLMMLLDSEYTVEPLVLFWRKLKSNPTKNVKEQLYRFLESGHFPITKTGNFQAYKRVAKDFKDLHSHTMDNSIGKVVTMDRSQVTEDPNITCASGLHVAAWAYARHEYGTTANTNGDRFLVVEIDPKDVVSVPVDHNNRKMRVCKYTVVEECEAPKEDVVVAGFNESFDEEKTDAALSTAKLISLDADNRIRIPNSAIAALKPKKNSKFGITHDGYSILVELAEKNIKYDAVIKNSKDVRINQTIQKSLGFHPDAEYEFEVEVDEVDKVIVITPR